MILNELNENDLIITKNSNSKISNELKNELLSAIENKKSFVLTFEKGLKNFDSNAKDKIHALHSSIHNLIGKGYAHINKSKKLFWFSPQKDNAQ